MDIVTLLLPNRASRGLSAPSDLWLLFAFSPAGVESLQFIGCLVQNITQYTGVIAANLASILNIMFL